MDAETRIAEQLKAIALNGDRRPDADPLARVQEDEYEGMAQLLERQGQQDFQQLRRQARDDAGQS